MDGMLSQEEINALLNGVNNGEDISDVASEPEGTAAESSGFELADSDKDAVGEISNISMGTAATTLSSLLNQKVNITTPKVSVSKWDDLAARYDRPCVMMQISYKEGIDGNNVLILKENDVRIITDLMMGGTGEVTSEEPLSELHLSAIGEAMNQMMGSAATSMSSMFSRKIDISPPVANVIETYTDTNENIPEFLKNEFVLVAFRMQIGELIDSEIMQLYPIDFAQELVQMFTSSIDGTIAPQVGDAPSSSGASSSIPPAGQASAPTPSPAPQPQPMPAPQPQPQMQQPAPDMSAMQQQMPPYGYQMPPYGYAPQPMYAQPMPPQNVQQASFQPFTGDLSAISQQENIDLIKDVPLEVTVELGRTSKSIKDILEFAPGTIVELNKIAGEPIDILVNGKYVAKGEVVVIEESFGVRITEIMKD
jgi:flagellar motor switch protein FliN/FliY